MAKHSSLGQYSRFLDPLPNLRLDPTSGFNVISVVAAVFCMSPHPTTEPGHSGAPVWSPHSAPNL